MNETSEPPTDPKDKSNQSNKEEEVSDWLASTAQHVAFEGFAEALAEAEVFKMSDFAPLTDDDIRAIFVGHGIKSAHKIRLFTDAVRKLTPSPSRFEGESASDTSGTLPLSDREYKILLKVGQRTREVRQTLESVSSQKQELVRQGETVVKEIDQWSQEVVQRVLAIQVSLTAKVKKEIQAGIDHMIQCEKALGSQLDMLLSSDKQCREAMRITQLEQMPDRLDTLMTVAAHMNQLKQPSLPVPVYLQLVPGNWRKGIYARVVRKEQKEVPKEEQKEDVYPQELADPHVADSLLNMMEQLQEQDVQQKAPCRILSRRTD